jgi:hypothetical protein
MSGGSPVTLMAAIGPLAWGPVIVFSFRISVSNNMIAHWASFLVSRESHWLWYLVPCFCELPSVVMMAMGVVEEEQSQIEGLMLTSESQFSSPVVACLFQEPALVASKAAGAGVDEGAREASRQVQFSNLASAYRQRQRQRQRRAGGGAEGRCGQSPHGPGEESTRRGLSIAGLVECHQEASDARGEDGLSLRLPGQA